MKYTFFALLTFLAACDWGQPIEYKKMDSVRFKGINFQDGTAVITAKAHFHNPKTVAADIIGLECDVFVDGTKMATVSEKMSANMPANSDFEIPLRIDVPLNKIFKGMGIAIKGKKVYVEMKGHVKVGKVGVGVNVPFEYADHQEISL